MTHAGRLGGLDLERLTPHVTCAAHDCHEKGPRGTSSEGKPTPPPGWYEVELPNLTGTGVTILFAHSLPCAQKVAAGRVETARPQSQHKPYLGG